MKHSMDLQEMDFFKDCYDKIVICRKTLKDACCIRHKYHEMKTQEEKEKEKNFNPQDFSDFKSNQIALRI